MAEHETLEAPEWTLSEQDSGNHHSAATTVPGTRAFQGGLGAFALFFLCSFFALSASTPNLG